MPRPASVVVLLLLAGCLGGPSAGRYSMATDPASRYGFRYVRDRESGLWVHRQCEARVSTKRKLPDPISTTEHGDLLHSTRFRPGSAGTGDLVPGQFELHDGWRVWRFTDLPNEDDLRSQSALGIQVEHPLRNGPSEWEPMEIFAYPPMATMVPDAWTEWTSAAAQRQGGFGWWEETTGQPAEPPQPVAFPFELRCRLLLKDHVYVD